MNRICNTCKIEKDLSMFAKYRYNGQLLHKAKCQECNKPSKQKYYQHNNAKIVEHNTEYAKINRNKINERNRLREQNDSGYKLFNLVRSTVKSAIKRNNGNKKYEATLKYLPYTIQELKRHIENLFEPWMTWENRGKYNSKTWNDNNQKT